MESTQAQTPMTETKAWGSVAHRERASYYKAYGITHAETNVSDDSTSSKVDTESLDEIPLENINGSTLLYHKGRVVLIPAPSADPKDPLNLPTWRKVTAIACLCFFAGLAVAAEAIIGALVPVFVLFYSGVSPHVLDNIKFPKHSKVQADPLAGFAQISPYPLWQVYLIASLPVLIVGISSYFLIPLGICFGRRPVILTTGALAIIGGVWAGFTTELHSHLGARCLQALGVGTVESLIPLILQDMVFIHWRNRAISAIFCSQGIIIVGFGMFSPMIIAATDWWWIYWITAAGASVGYVGLIFFLPETRYKRTPSELKGRPRESLKSGEQRLALDPMRYGPLDRRTLYGFQKDIWWKECGQAMIATLQSMLFPNLMYLTVLNSALVAMVLAAGQAGAPVLLAYGWPFKYLGFAVSAIVVAAVFVAVGGGWGADKIANYVTRKYMGGKREPEVHVVNMVIPMLSTCLGCLLFGIGGHFVNEIHWMCFISSIFFLAYGLLVVNIVGAVYAVECYPDWAGPVLVNISSFRNIIAFGMSFKVVDWLNHIGYLQMFAMWAGVIFGLGVIGLPLMWIYGKRSRIICGRYVDRKGMIAI